VDVTENFALALIYPPTLDIIKIVTDVKNPSITFLSSAHVKP